MKTKVLVTGLHGYIGSRFIQMVNPSFEIIDLHRKGKKYEPVNVYEIVQTDITDYRKLTKVLQNQKIDVILHLAAKTHIDRCEKDKKYGKDSEVWKINVDGAKNIVKWCSVTGAYLIYLSTECVFDGRRGLYKEDDEPNPINWYGYTKYIAEQEIRLSKARFCILRSVLAYGHIISSPHDLVRIIWNKLEKKTNCQTVDNQFLSITFIDDLIRVILFLIKRKPSGIYHYAGKEVLSPFDVTKIIKEYLKIKENIALPVDLMTYFGDRAKYRLVNASLSSEKIKKEFDIKSSDFRQNLEILKNRFYT